MGNSSSNVEVSNSIMARALRLEIPSGRYHVTARSNERRPIFRQDRDRVHFLELLSDWPARFGVRLHAHVLMSSHYHYMTVAKAVSRFGKRLAEHRNLAGR